MFHLFLNNLFQIFELCRTELFKEIYLILNDYLKKFSLSRIQVFLLRRFVFLGFFNRQLKKRHFTCAVFASEFTLSHSVYIGAPDSQVKPNCFVKVNLIKSEIEKCKG